MVLIDTNFKWQQQDKLTLKVIFGLADERELILDLKKLETK